MKQIISYMEKPGRRLLAFVLCCVFLAAGVFFVQSARYAWNRGWYAGGSRSFAYTNDCENYVRSCNAYVYNYMCWKGEVSEAVATGYSGEAYACVVTNLDTGEVILDTTTECSAWVDASVEGTYSYSEEVYLASGEAVETAEAADEVVLSGKSMKFHIQGYINLPVGPYEGCYAEYRLHEIMTGLAPWAIPLGVLFLLLAAAMAAVLLLRAIAGPRGEKLSLLGKIPFDGLAVALCAAVWLLCSWADGLGWKILLNIAGAYNVSSNLINVLAMPVVRGFLWTAAGLCTALALTENLRWGGLRKRMLLRKLPLFGGITACVVLMTAIGIFLLQDHLRVYGGYGFLYGGYNTRGWLTVLNLAVCLVCLGVVYGAAKQLRRLRRAAEALAGGDLAYKVNVDKLPRGLKEQGEALNRIGEGMKLAVEEQLKGERFKTELITNVSHDLKTPLTSIVSYVDLLQKEDISPERAKEYIEVIERQSAKLKKLTEDLVEASKASSGAIEVHREPVDVAELLSQSVGEYTERLQKASVEPVTSLPEEGCVMDTDGRLLWRVLDNLIQNIVKYAQPGTRAYFDLTKTPDGLFIELKNTSAQSLNIPAEALMERFVRGDSARSTEGSGLGLSIAQSLTELLGGTMSLYLDGDLFKVTLRFEGVENA